MLSKVSILDSYILHLGKLEIANEEKKRKFEEQLEEIKRKS